MRLGDLIGWSGRRWLVQKIDRQTRTAILYDGYQTEQVPDDHETRKPEECQVIANPADDWPLIMLAAKPKLGRLLKITRPQMTGGEIELVWLQDWVIYEPMQPGGALFINPMVTLRQGDMALAAYDRGKVRVQIPRDFLSTAEKRARAAAPEPVTRISVYDRLRRNEFTDDDD
jgi:hypothetical protein